MTPLLPPSEIKQIQAIIDQISFEILGVSEYDGSKMMVKKFGAKRAYEIASSQSYWRWKNIAYIIRFEHGSKF